MKHKLLSLFALAGAMLMSTSVWAQSKWEAPVQPTEPVRAPFEGEWVTPTAGNSYYIYHVGAAQFMGAGRDWGTRTVTTNDSIVSPTGTKAVHNQSTSNTKNFAIPYSISTADSEAGYLYLSPQNIDLSGYVTGEGNASWQDGGTDRAGKWQIVPVEGSELQFLLHCANVAPYNPEAYVADDPETEDVNESEAGLDEYRLLGVCAVETNSYTWNDLRVNGTNSAGVSHKVAWKFVEATDDVAKSIRAWRAASKITYDAEVKEYNAAMLIYNARVKLYETLNEAAATPNVDYSDAEAVYLKADATEAELLTANSALAMKVLLATATEYPVDITSVLQNPDFEAGTATGAMPPGWDITITGQNLGQQNRTDTNPETGLAITNFIEAWHGSSLGDGVIAQTVYGLPAGIYRLECDASICHDPENGDGSDIVGAGLFIKAGVLRESTPIGTRRLYVSHFEVEFENDGRNAMQFGLYAESTNANWLSADNFKLWYVGPLTENPNYKNLQNYLAEIQDKYNNEDFGHAYLCADSLTALDNAMQAASDISTTATDEEIDAAYYALENAYNGVLTSIKVYETLRPYTTFNEEGGSKLAYYEDKTANNKLNEFSQTIHNLQESFDKNYEEGTWSDEEVKAQIESIVPIIIAWVQAHPESVVKGNDLTMLLINADFSEGDYRGGWDAADDEIQPDKDYGTIPGWTITSGNITQLHGSVIETYHRKFDFNQTIKNMPAGVYDISVQGFVRHDGSATDKTIFYAGDLQTSLMLRSEQWSESNIYDPERDGNPCGGANGDQQIENSHGDNVYVPNGMSGFYFWKQTENTEGATMDYLKWQEGDLYYTNHIKATLNEAGDFTIGMKSLGADDWIIWSNFNIIYLGNAGDIYPLMAEEEFDALTRVLGNTDYLTLKAQADYAEIAKVEYSVIETLEDYNAYKARIDALIAYIKEGTQLGDALHELLLDYQQRDVTFDTSAFYTGSYAEYTANLENGNCPDNDYLRNAPDALATEWTQCALKGADITLFNNLDGVIVNPQYTNADASFSLNGWSMEKADEVTFGNYLANMGVAEVFSPSGEYKHYQTIKGLSEGYYRVTVDGYFRPADMKKADGREACVSIPSRAFLFAESSSETFTSPLKNILVGNDTQWGVGAESTWDWSEELIEYTPNNVEAAAHYFNNVINYEAEETNLSGEADNQSVYRNVVNAYVGTDGILTIGITNHGIAETVANDWACFSNWTLSYMGTVAPDAIKGISEKGATAPTAIFTIDGRQASRLQRGLNIVRQADGNVKKVLVK